MTVILSVGRDAMIQATRSSVLRTGGYLVRTAWTASEAVRRFLEGDFDLVILCHSIPDRDRDWLIRQIRTLGSSVPILYIARIADNFPQENALFSIVGSEPHELLHGVEQALGADSVGRS